MTKRDWRRARHAGRAQVSTVDETERLQKDQAAKWLENRAPLKLTPQQIDAKRSKRGGWDRKTLASWGVPWPPPRGWRHALLTGTPIPKIGEPNSIHTEEAERMRHFRAI